MHRIRKAAIASTTVSALTITTAISCHALGWPVQTDRFQVIVLTLIGMAAGTISVAFWCTYITIRSLRTSTAEFCNALATETKALHRSMVVIMEEYGNARAIDAVVANERRHINDHRVGLDTVEFTRSNDTNVTPIRKRHEPS